MPPRSEAGRRQGGERGDHEEVEEEVQPELRFETLALRQSPTWGGAPSP